MRSSRAVLAAALLALGAASVAPSAATARTERAAISGEPDVWIGPVYFSWFRVNRHGTVMGQYYSPWTPLEGRRAWDGSVGYHKRHVGHIAKAGFNMIFAVDTWEYRAEQRNLFTAIHERARTGRKVPRVAPYFAAGSFACRDCRNDFTTKAGRHEFYRVVRSWFDRFFDVLSPDDLVWMDDRVLIGLWWVAGARSAEPGFFSEMNRRLERDFGFRALWSANFKWENAEPDEINHLFASLDAREINRQGNVDLLVGFWPPRGQDPAKFLPRAGGATYGSAWDGVIARVSSCAEPGEVPRRISIVSYNELTEGSGIYPALCVAHNNKRDRHWSGEPSPARCVDAPCHPFRKQDRWAPDCSARRAPYLYLDISRKKIRKLERALRSRAGCHPGRD